jgi:alpha-L-rhamnosidase
MLMNKRIFILSIFSLLFFAGSLRAAIGITDLRVEQLKNPTGIDVRQPRLGWRIESSEQNVMQTAYHILVASSPELLVQGKGDIWDSGKIESNASQWVTYQGKSLKRNAPYYWKVKVYTNKGEADWSTPAFGLWDYSTKQTGKVSGLDWTVLLRVIVKPNGAAWQPVTFAKNLF